MRSNEFLGDNAAFIFFLNHIQQKILIRSGCDSWSDGRSVIWSVSRSVGQSKRVAKKTIQEFNSNNEQSTENTKSRGFDYAPRGPYHEED